jgi:hypothetical protein
MLKSPPTFRFFRYSCPAINPFNALLSCLLIRALRLCMFVMDLLKAYIHLRLLENVAPVVLLQNPNLPPEFHIQY